MGPYATNSIPHGLKSEIPLLMRLSKRILNAIAARASLAVGRSQFAALPLRYLDDIGVTAAERAAALGFEEPTTDGWRVVASHL
jgi:hypothetical protein